MLPEYPRLCRTLTMVARSPDGLRFCSDAGHFSLKGARLWDRVAKIAMLFDGGRTLDQIIHDHSEFSPNAIFGVQALLFQHGMLENGPAQDALDIGDTATLNYFSHLASQQSGACAGETLHRQYKNLKISLHTTSKVLEDVALAHCEPHLTLCNTRDIVSSPPDFIVLHADLKKTEDAEREIATYHQAHLPVILLTRTAEGFALGPFLIPHFGCHAEAALRYLRFFGVSHVSDVPDAIIFEQINIFAAHFAARKSEGLPVNKCILFPVTADALPRLHDVPVEIAAQRPIPIGCEEGMVSRDVKNMRLYLAASQRPPAYYRSARDYLSHYQPGNVALSSGRTEHFMRAAPREYEAPPCLQDEGLRDVLHMALGTSMSSGRSRTPSGENITSPLIYLAEWQFDRPVRRLYYYSGDEHGLTYFNERFLPHEKSNERAPTHILVIGSIERLQQKYGHFSYRISMLDCGVMMASLSLALHHHGRRFTIRRLDPHIDFSLDLEIPSDTHYPAFMLDVEQYLEKDTPHSGKPSLMEAAMRDDAPPFLPPDLEQLTRILSGRYGRDLHDLLDQRRSTRLLHGCLKIEDIRSLTVDIFLIHRALSETGIFSLMILHQNELGGACLTTHHPLSGKEETSPVSCNLSVEAIAQRILADAPVIILPVIDLSRSAALLGGGGMRLFFNATGALLMSMWLLITARGWRGCPCGAVTESAFSAFGIDGVDRLIP